MFDVFFCLEGKLYRARNINYTKGDKRAGAVCMRDSVARAQGCGNGESAYTSSAFPGAVQVIRAVIVLARHNNARRVKFFFCYFESTLS